MNKKVLWGLGILVIVVTGFLFLTKNPTGNAVRAELIDEGDYVKIPLSGISKTAEFYNFKGIEFFVVESKEGLVKTAFNACDVCFKPIQEGTLLNTSADVTFLLIGVPEGSSTI